MSVLGLHCCTVFSLVAESRGYSLFVILGLLIMVASLVAEKGMQASVSATPGLWSTASMVVVHRLS